MADARTTFQKVKKISGIISMAATAGLIITTVIRKLRKKEEANLTEPIEGEGL